MSTADRAGTVLQHATCCLTYNRKYSIWSTLYYKSHASSTWLTPRCPAWVQGSYDRSTPNPTIIIQVEPRPALDHTVSTICKPRMIHVAFNNTVYSECNMYNVQCTFYMYNVQCTMYNVQCTMYNVQCTMYNVHVKCTCCGTLVLTQEVLPPGQLQSNWKILSIHSSFIPFWEDRPGRPWEPFPTSSNL